MAYFGESRHRLALTPFHEAFAMFRFAVIFIGISDRALQGTAVGSVAGDAMRLARASARLGCRAAGLAL